VLVELVLVELVLVMVDTDVEVEVLVVTVLTSTTGSSIASTTTSSSTPSDSCASSMIVCMSSDVNADTACTTFVAMTSVTSLIDPTTTLDVLVSLPEVEL